MPKTGSNPIPFIPNCPCRHEALHLDGELGQLHQSWPGAEEDEVAVSGGVGVEVAAQQVAAVWLLLQGAEAVQDE
jgi:hypothetical protein